MTTKTQDAIQHIHRTTIRECEAWLSETITKAEGGTV